MLRFSPLKHWLAGNRRNKAVVYALLFAGFVALGYWVVRLTAAPTSGPIVEIPSSALDFGEAWSHTELCVALPIVNRTSRSVKVLDLRTSCACRGTIDPRRFTLGPKGKRVVYLRADLAQAVRRSKGQRRFPFSVPVLAVVEGSSRQLQRFDVRGVVRHVMEFSPGRVDFFEEVVRGGPVPERVVRARCWEPVVGLEADSEGSWFAVAVRPADSEGREFELEVAPRPDMPLGPFEESIAVRPVLATAQECPPAKLPVVGTVVPDARTEPDVLLLGPVAVGETIERQVRIRSRSGKAIRLGRVNFDGDTSPVDVQTLVRVERCEVTLALRPRVPGEHQFAIRLCASDAAGSEMDVRVPVSWYATGVRLNDP